MYCPDGTIAKVRDDEGVCVAVVVDYDFCKGCGVCAKVCPVPCIAMVDEHAGENEGRLRRPRLWMRPRPRWRCRGFGCLDRASSAATGTGLNVLFPKAGRSNRDSRNPHWEGRLSMRNFLSGNEAFAEGCGSLGPR